MKKIFEKIRGKIGLIEEMYDFIRIVDPVNKSSIIIKTNEIKKKMGHGMIFGKENQLAVIVFP